MSKYLIKYTEITKVLPYFNTLVVNMIAIQYHVVQYIHNKTIKKKIKKFKSVHQSRSKSPFWVPLYISWPSLFYR